MEAGGGGGVEVRGRRRRGGSEQMDAGAYQIMANTILTEIHAHTTCGSHDFLHLTHYNLELSFCTKYMYA